MVQLRMLVVGNENRALWRGGCVGWGLNPPRSHHDCSFVTNRE